MRRATKAVVVVAAIVVVAFFCAPLLFASDIPNHAGHSERYESASCAIFNVGISYGYQSFMGGPWVLRTSCGPP